MNVLRIATAALSLVLIPIGVLAAPVNYTIDPTHTHPLFETDHFGGVSVWRGLFATSSGAIVLDKDAGSGTVDVQVDTDSVDFGMGALNDHVKSPDMLDAAKFPKATYKGKLAKFVNGAPTEVVGDFTLHGVTKPLTLKINSFKCIMDPRLKTERCGADAIATFNRADFGVDFGKQYGFNMDVTLRIQVEALQAH